MAKPRSRVANDSPSPPPRGRGPGCTVIELSIETPGVGPPLPARNERGEGWGEGKSNKNATPLPGPLLLLRRKRGRRARSIPLIQWQCPPGERAGLRASVLLTQRSGVIVKASYHSLCSLASSSYSRAGAARRLGGRRRNGFFGGIAESQQDAPGVLGFAFAQFGQRGAKGLHPEVLLAGGPFHPIDESAQIDQLRPGVQEI